jgi:protein-tyrosine phosphatase
VRPRDLDWDGCLNVRDLGGLRTATGEATRFGQVVRMDNPSYLTPAGWTSLVDYGVRTIIGLRTIGTTDDEPADEQLPSGVRLRHGEIEDGTDPRFVERCVITGRWGTPLYFADMLAHWPDRCAAAVAAVAQAPVGGVAISCGRGCDRTGLLSFLLGAIADVTAEDLAADWLRSVERLRPRNDGFEDALAEMLTREEQTVEGCVQETLARFDVADRLCEGGLRPAHIAHIRERLRGTVQPTAEQRTYR